MKKIIQIALVLFSVNQLFSQDLKTYSGSFERGIATYQYYENEKYERIFHGPFLYSKMSVFGDTLFTAKGNFKENLKDGKWCYKDGLYKTIGSFKNGFLDGKWEYWYNSKEEKELLARTCFSNGIFVGDFYYNYNAAFGGYILRFEIEGQFNENGMVDGEWKILQKNIEDIRKYKDGVLFWQLKRNITNGEILAKADKADFVNTFFKNRDNKTGIAFIDGTPYRAYPKNDESVGNGHGFYKDVVIDDSKFQEDILQNVFRFFYADRLSDNIRYEFKKGEEAKEYFFKQKISIAKDYIAEQKKRIKDSLEQERLIDTKIEEILKDYMEAKDIYNNIMESNDRDKNILKNSQNVLEKYDQIENKAREILKKRSNAELLIILRKMMSERVEIKDKEKQFQDNLQKYNDLWSSFTKNDEKIRNKLNKKSNVPNLNRSYEYVYQAVVRESDMRYSRFLDYNEVRLKRFIKLQAKVIELMEHDNLRKLERKLSKTESYIEILDLIMEYD